MPIATPLWKGNTTFVPLKNLLLFAQDLKNNPQGEECYSEAVRFLYVLRLPISAHI